MRTISEQQITGLAGVPTVWAILTRATPALAKTRLPSLRYITNSGGRVPSETVMRLRELLPTTQHLSHVRFDGGLSVDLSASGRNRASADLDRQGHSRNRDFRRDGGRSADSTRRAGDPRPPRANRVAGLLESAGSHRAGAAPPSFHPGHTRWRDGLLFGRSGHAGRRRVSSTSSPATTT